MTRHVLQPVWPGYFADPFVLRHGGEYYAYGTAATDERQDEFGREFPVLHSTDLSEWRPLGYALTPASEHTASAHWAPEVCEHQGTFYMYYSVGGDEGEGHHLRVATATDPAGSFEDIGPLQMEEEPFSIDANPFLDPVSGDWCLFFSKDFFDEPVGTGIAAARLSSNMRQLVGRHETVLRASGDWQVYERDRFWYGKRWPKWHTVEGPCVVYREDRYWLLYSGGLWKGANYGVGCAVADSVLGPYHEPEPGPVVLKAGAGLRGPGHNSVVQGPDGVTDYIVFHAWDDELTKRQMYVAPLRWTERGPRVDL
jgi:beta-xylosidase